MPIATFEGLSCVVIVMTLVAMGLRRRGDIGALLCDYAALAAAGWVGEDSCIRLYQHYTYADSWHLRVDHVPLLVPLIWPLVILSARDFIDAITGLRAQALPFGRALGVAGLVALVVVFDAALIEVISVKAGYWSWAEPGHVAVPVFGILGWGFFAWPAMTLLGSRLPGRHFLVVGLAPLTAHVLLFVTWQACFRWILRSELGHASLAGLAVLSAIAMPVLMRAKESGRQTACASNLRQLHLATAMYRSEWDGDGVFGDAHRMGLPRSFMELAASQKLDWDVFRCPRTPSEIIPQVSMAGFVKFWRWPEHDLHEPRWETNVMKFEDQMILIVDMNHNDRDRAVRSRYTTRRASVSVSAAKPSASTRPESHNSYTPNGCLLAVHIAGPEISVE